MVKLSNMTKCIKGSPIRKMFNIAATMDDVVSFAIGEPDFTTADNIIDAACRALQRGETHYTPNAGIYPLREAIAKRIKNKNGVPLDPEKEIIVTGGGMEALMLCMMTTIEAGDEVIISNPYWSNHPAQVSMCGGKPVFVKVYEEDGFVYNIENLKKAITPNTKAILINSPANPTGGVVSRERLEEIADIARYHDLLIISDEVYQYFVYDGTEFVSIASFDGMKERTVIVDSFSKSYAMTGWRIGYAAGPENIIQNMIKLQENVISCVHSATQFAAIEALEGPQDHLQYMIDKYTRRRELMVNGINAIDGLSCKKPMGAFYVFANISQTGMSSEEFSLELLKKAKVVVVPGSGFGDAGEGFVRISYATSEENISEGLKRMKSFIETL